MHQRAREIIAVAGGEPESAASVSYAFTGRDWREELPEVTCALCNSTHLCDLYGRTRGYCWTCNNRVPTDTLEEFLREPWWLRVLRWLNGESSKARARRWLRADA